MSYSVYITRSNWWETSSNLISLQDWLSACEPDPTLRIENCVMGVNPTTGENIQINSEAMAFWICAETHNEYIFDYRNGKIAFSYDEFAIKKGKELAEKLNAQVQGDDGELY